MNPLNNIRYSNFAILFIALYFNNPTCNIPSLLYYSILVRSSKFYEQQLTCANMCLWLGANTISFQKKKYYTQNNLKNRYRVQFQSGNVLFILIFRYLPSYLYSEILIFIKEIIISQRFFQNNGTFAMILFERFEKSALEFIKNIQDLLPLFSDVKN